MTGNKELPVDLILLSMHNFDLILGMDWLLTYHVILDCINKKVTFRIPGQPECSFVASSICEPFQLVSTLKAQELFRKGCQCYLAHIIYDQGNLNFKRILIVRDFPNVFPKELPGIPLKREVDFTIDVIPGTSPISKVPYHMAPVELRELKTLLKEMLINGIIGPSVSP